jgi:hypothetical protein
MTGNGRNLIGFHGGTKNLNSLNYTILTPHKDYSKTQNRFSDLKMGFWTFLFSRIWKEKSDSGKYKPFLQSTLPLPGDRKERLQTARANASIPFSNNLREGIR